MRLLLVALIVLASVPLSADEDIRLRLHQPVSTYALGTPLLLELSVTNEGDEATYIELPRGLGPEALNIVAENKRCSYPVDPVHFDQPVEELRFAFVPLQPGSSYRLELARLNAPGQGIYLELPGPGTYVFSASLRSDGAPIEGVIWPIWRGTAESPPLQVEVVNPPPETTEDWSKRLSRCVAEAICEDLAAIEYFRFVKAARIGDLLQELLTRDPLMYSAAGAALVHQQREQDLGFLRALLQDPRLDQNHRDYYQQLFDELESSRGCD